jgi:hypothetical protein
MFNPRRVEVEAPIGLAIVLLIGAAVTVEGCAACDIFADRREVYLITDWTLNKVSCEIEGEDIRDERLSTHLIFNPLGQTNDQEAIATTCMLGEGTANPCENQGEQVDFAGEISLRLSRFAGDEWQTETVVHGTSEGCAGHVEQARLTFPVAQRFRLELRRSYFAIPGASDCATQGPAQARTAGCTQFEVLHGDFEVELTAPSESSSGGGSSFDD